MSRDSPDRKISYLRRIMGENSEKYISVLLPLKIDWMPYYRLPQGESAGPGEWVRVNFANREYCGIVTGTVPAPDNPEKIKDILHVERNLPPVTDKELSLWKMVAEYYMCSAGEVFKAAYPSVRISQTEALAKKMEKERQRKEKATGALKSRIAGIEDKIRQKEMLLGKSGNPDTKTAANLRAGIERLRLQANEFEKRLLALMDTGGRKGPAGNDRIEDITLTGTQMTVYREISGSQDASGNADVPHTGAGTAGNDRQRPPKPVLIKGVTGSGKTEIYLKTARETLLKGKNVLYLVPEIAVSGQLTGRVRRIFGDLLLTFHFAPWDHVMKSGKTLKEEFFEGLKRGSLQSASSSGGWSFINGLGVLDEQRFEEVKQSLLKEGKDAKAFYDEAYRFFTEAMGE